MPVPTRCTFPRSVPARNYSKTHSHSSTAKFKRIHQLVCYCNALEQKTAWICKVTEPGFRNTNNGRFIKVRYHDNGSSGLEIHFCTSMNYGLISLSIFFSKYNHQWRDKDSKYSTVVASRFSFWLLLQCLELNEWSYSQKIWYAFKFMAPFPCRLIWLEGASISHYYF